MKLTLIKTFYTLMLMITCTGAAFAQTQPATAKVTGSLTDEQNKPISYATVSLLRARDSSLVKGALSNDAGNYSFDRVGSGNYLIKATNVGYGQTLSKGFAVTNDDVAVPVITMKESAQNLNAV